MNVQDMVSAMESAFDQCEAFEVFAQSNVSPDRVCQAFGPSVAAEYRSMCRNSPMYANAF